MNERLPLAFLLAAVALSLYGHSMVFNEWVMPTYGNTMIHVASARHAIETGEYPMWNDYSYGGGQPNLYVPLYRFLYAELVALTGLSFDLVGRLIVVLYALLLPLGFYLLGRELAGEWAGVASAFLASLSPELLIYTVRPLPQGLGLALLPIGFYFLAKKDLRASVLSAFLIVLAHQEAGVFFVGCAFAFGALEVARAFLAGKRVFAESMPGFAAWGAGTLTYLGWHFFAVRNLDLFALAQFQHHEGAFVSLQLLYDKTGLVLLALGALGFALLAYKALENKLKAPGVFALSALLVGLFCIKNDLFGLQVFMDRFIVFLHVSMIPVAALALKEACSFSGKLEERIRTRLSRDG